jgi:hypothetical protein
MSIIEPEDFQKMQSRLDKAQKILDSLSTSTYFSKYNELLEAAATQIELITLDVRKLCEKNKAAVKTPKPQGKICHSKEIFGEIELTDEGWVHIWLDTLLPSGKQMESTVYITDSISRLLDGFVQAGGQLPLFESAFLAIVERCDYVNRCSFDQDNKGFKSVQNALKGRLFADDNQFELSLGLFTELSDECACHIYILPQNAASDFFAQLTRLIWSSPASSPAPIFASFQIRNRH